MRILLLAMGLLGGGVGAAWAQVAGVEHVVIIGVDGMSPDGVQKAHTPALNTLIKEGAFSMHARAVLPSSSSPNWASMIMGAGPEQHGITSNDWRPDDFVLPSTAYASDGYFPTLFWALREKEPDAVIAVVYDWGGFGNLFAHETVDYAVDADGPEKTVEEAIRLLQQERPRLTFIHLDHVDGAGHGEGHGSDVYYQAVERADSLIGEVMAGLEQAGMAESTLILVTADHGGEGSGHGGETLSQVEIPWILHGPGVAVGRRLTDPINTFDTAATAAFALELALPEAWIGRPVRSAFADAERDPEQPQTGYVPAPRITPRGGLFVDSPPAVQLAVDDDSAEVHYTLDGSDPTTSSPRYDAPLVLEGEGAQTLTARAFRGRDTSDPSEAIYRLVTSASGSGPTYQYYEGEGWQQIPDFDALTPVREGQAYEFSLEGLDHRAGPFAVRFEGDIEVEEAGLYTFYTVSDDGSRLYLDGQELVDNDGAHGPMVQKGSTELEAGRHPIVVTYFNGEGGQSLEVWYQGPGIPKQIIPSTVLYPATDAREADTG
ncbi:MAG: alkaline phosphatase family protein [Rhodothermales bacterium]